MKLDDLSMENDDLKAMMEEKDQKIMELELKIADPSLQQELARTYKETAKLQD
jgi:Ca2+-binding EF-hand superfamily protein